MPDFVTRRGRVHVDTPEPAPATVCVESQTGHRWTVRAVEAQHPGRCVLCQRRHQQGEHIFLGHGHAFCEPCVERRPADVADRLEARGVRSKNTP